MMDPYKPIGILFPKNIRRRLAQEIRYSNFSIDADTFLGFAVFFGIGLGVVMAYALNYYDVLPFEFAFPISLFLVEFMLYIWLNLSADSKAKFVDEALPDALQLMSSNIRAGMTTDKALILAARPEFGPLEQEIRRIGKETMAGVNLTESLQKTDRKIRSKNLQRAIDLIVQSLKSGGKLADLLDQTANDLRDQQIIQKEISASVLMYVIFIFIAVGLGAPLLFSMSSFLVELLAKNMAMIAADMPSFSEMGGTAAMPIAVGKITITSEFIRTYSIISLVASSFFGSLVIGLILKGEEKLGVKYFPVLLVISVSLFLIGRFILDSTLGNMMQF
ncbi:MAG: type II secretion system F family protein [Candidatus Altiarchaeota archaeon]